MEKNIWEGCALLMLVWIVAIFIISMEMVHCRVGCVYLNVAIKLPTYIQYRVIR